VKLLTNYVYKLRPSQIQTLKMSAWVDMLRSHYNWCLNDRITQYHQQFAQGDYCDIRIKSEACPLTTFVSKSGATGNPWKDSKVDKEGKIKNPRRSASDIQIMVRADCAEPSARHSNAQKVSPRSQSKRGEFGNLRNQDIKVAKS
jgi:transposase